MIPVRRNVRSALATSVTPELAPVATRTRWLRIGLAVAALALLGVAVALARGSEARPTSYFASGAGGILVLDLSTSVDRMKQQRVQRVLRSLSGTGTRVGLVVFSDTAYEALPPGTRGEELRPLLRFFRSPPFSRWRERGQGRRSFGITSPWAATFRGGTRISTGLREARRAIERDRIADPSVVLISDLDDSAFDTRPLTQELIRYERDGIRLRVVPLFAESDDEELFANLVGGDVFLPARELVRNTRVEERQTLVGEFPAALVAAAAALLALLAVNERACARLGWTRPA